MARPSPFALLWISQALSALGTSISSLAYPLLVLELTGSPVQAGLVGTVAAVTGLLLKIPGGALADRLRFRPLLLATDAGRALLVGALASSILLGVATLPLVLVSVALEVACGAVFGPAEFGLLRLVVPSAERGIAVGRMQSRSSLAGLIGPLAGGALFGLAPALPFAADALSYLVSLLCLLGVRITTEAGRPPPQVGSRSRGAQIGGAGIAAGWRWLRGEPFLLAGGLWSAALVAVFGAVGLATLVLARERGADPAELGLIFTIGAAGGLAGALLTPALQRRMRPQRLFLLAAAVDTLACLGLLLSPSPYAIGVAGAGAFFLAPAVSASLFGELSLRAPDALVGRAQATLGLVVGSLAPVAPVAIGAVLEGVGAVPAILCCAAGFALLTGAALLLPAPGPRPGA